MTFDHLHLPWVGILTNYFVPGVGNLTFFYGKCQNPHPLPDPAPLGLNIDRCKLELKHELDVCVTNALITVTSIKSENISENISPTFKRLISLSVANAGFNSTCYHPPPGTAPGICNFFLTWRSIPHPRARRKRQFPVRNEGVETTCIILDVCLDHLAIGPEHFFQFIISAQHVTNFDGHQGSC